MSDTVDLTLLGGAVQDTARDVRLLRLQLGNVVSRLAGVDQRLAGVDQRLAVMGQSFHDLVGEMSRGFGQQQQQITRIEKRIEGVDAVLSALRAEAAENTAQIIRAIKGER